MSEIISLDKLTEQLEILESKTTKEIQDASDQEALEKIRIKLLGKKGKLSEVLSSMGKLPGNERPLIGKRANSLKSQVQEPS